MTPPFAARVSRGMRERGFSLRGFCRAAGIDPSFFSKVLSGKRSPPEEAILRRIAQLLEVPPAELIVLAGRIPSEWRAVWADPQLFHDMNSLAMGRLPAPKQPAWSSLSRPRRRPVPRQTVFRRGELAEELL